jgi:hypothetical protein
MTTMTEEVPGRVVGDLDNIWREIGESIRKDQVLAHVIELLIGTLKTALPEHEQALEGVLQALRRGEVYRGARDCGEQGC